MRVDLHVEARCVDCGAERSVEPASAERVLEADDVVFAELDEACPCGARRVRVQATVKLHS